MIGVQKVLKKVVNRYGIVKLREGTREIEDIIEKPLAEEAPSQLAVFGRMILDQNIVNILRETKLGKGNELWLNDAIKSYVKQGGIFLAREVEDGEWMTTGDALNYLKTTLAYAFERKDVSKELKKYIKKII